ncbi:hypothetical protein [Gimesia panareensis]|uniref:hypothetical protein n=1 Tax=Gimesia panareensis TaxID=2527978 RepID=UPI00118C19E1|nr:hypothetical protein [Gimesia panareensis]QDU48792.1 hypothetical protein Pan110_11080 [Gimesia panareensis]
MTVVRPVFNTHSLLLNRFWMWLIAFCCGAPLNLLPAAEPQTVDLAPVARIKEVTVPGQDPSRWPEGNWYPVPLKKYEALKAAALLKKNTPPNSWIQEATYSATLDGDHLVEGQLTWVMHCSRNEPGFIDLSKLNLAVHELKWGAQNAVWGLAPDQRTLLLVDHFSENLAGHWSLKGRQQPLRTEFQFELPETVVSQVYLKVPRGRVLTTSVGYVTGPLKSDDPAYDLWQIELGGQSRFQVIVHQAEKPQNAPQQILYHQFAQVGVREDGLRLREDFQIEVLNAPVQKLEFEAPAEYEIYSVTLGNDLSLPFEVKKHQGKQLVIVDLIDPLLGISRPLSVRALSSPSLESEIEIPRLKLRQAHYLGGTVHLDISSPLETHSIKSSDLRQTGVLIQEEQGEAYDFKQYSPDARLSYQLALPDLNLSAKVHSLVQIEEKNWRLKSRIHWSSAAGSTYRLEAMIPAGWEITQVSSPAESSSGNLVWDVEQSGKQQKLSVRLPVSVSPEAPYTLEIQARRLVPVASRNMNLFGVKPLGCYSVDRILEISAPEQVALLFQPDQEVQELTPGELPANWKFPIVNSGESRYFHLSPYSGTHWGSLKRSDLEQKFEVVASSYIALNDKSIQENFILNCLPPVGGIQRVLVYLSETGPPVEWTLPASSGLQSKLSIKKLPVSAHQKWYLPNLGELWELSFSAPVFKEIEIRGERQRPFGKNVRASLVFAPQAQPFQGVVRVLNSNELNLRMKTEGLLLPPDSQERPGNQRNQRNYEWNYEQPLGSLTIARSSELPENTLEQGTATLVVESRFGHGNGEPDVHEATITLDLSKTFEDKFLFRFPAAVKLISTSVNNRRITPIEAEGQFLVPLFDQLDTYRITIHYQTKAPENQLTAVRQIPFPQINQRVLETDWDFTLPQGIRLLSGPADMVLQEPLPEESLTRRFLGVLGRVSTPKHNGETEWNALVLFPVEFGTLETTNISQSGILSWIVLLTTLFCGLLLRIFGIGLRDKICIVVALIALLLSWNLSYPLAQISGSCFTGLLIVMLIPRRFLRQEVKTPIEDQSTKAYEQPLSSLYSAARLLLFAVLGSSVVTGYAQTDSAVKDRNRVSTTPLNELVLLPESAGSTIESYAYLSPHLLQTLEAYVSEPAQPEYLLSAAHYQGAIQDNQLLTLKARYTVEIPAGRSDVTIQLPMHGGNLSGPESCRVDGKAVPVLLDAAGQSILITVNNETRSELKPASTKDGPLEASKPVLPFSYQQHEIELTLHPAVRLSATGGQFELAIPPVATNNFVCSFHEPVQLVELFESTGISRYHLGGKKQFSTFFKENSLLKLKWFSNRDSDVSPLNLSASVMTNAEISPSLIKMDVQVKYNVLNGKVDYLFWKLPAGTIVRSVKSAGMSVTPAISRSEDGRQEDLLLELSESKEGEFVVDAILELPVNYTLDVITLPALDFSSGKLDSQAVTIKINSWQVGVRTGPEFELEQAGALPEGVLSISAKTPSKQIESSILKSSALLFQLNQPAQIGVMLKPKNPDRSARINQSLVINQKNIDWTFTAELRVSQAPAFRHTLIVPEALRIESLSVKEEDVERLAHWHRIGNRITLFLKNKTSGLQDLTLKGWLPVRKMGSMTIPNIQIADVTIEDSILTLFKKPQIDVKLISPSYRTLQDDTVQPASAEHSTLVGRYQMLNSDPGTIQLSLKPRNSVTTVDSLTIVDALEDHRLELTQTLRFVQPVGEMQKPMLLIPAEYGEEFSLDGMPFELLEKMADGLQRVELDPGSSGTREKTVTVRATIVKPLGELGIPPVILENAQSENHYLLLSDNQEFQLADKKLRKPLAADQVPVWVQARCDSAPHFDCDRVFFSSQLPWRLTPASQNAGIANEESIPFMETEIILSHQDFVHGLTHIRLFNQTSRALTLNWPGKTKLMAVLINGENDTTIKQETGTLEIPLNGGPQFYNITLFWESYQIDHEYFVDHVWLETPRPDNFPVDQNLIKIVTAENYRTFLTDYVSPFTYYADKLEAQLKIAGIELELSEDGFISPATWEAISREYNELETITTDSRQERDEVSAELNRFAELRERVFFIRQYVDPDKKVETETASFVSRFHQKLDPVSARKIRFYAGPLNSGSEAVPLSAWVIPNLYLNLVVGSLGLLILLPILGRCVQSRSADWLNLHPAVALLTLGIIWLLFLTPVYLGLAFVVLGMLIAIKSRKSETPESSHSVASTSGVPGISE